MKALTMKVIDYLAERTLEKTSITGYALQLFAYFNWNPNADFKQMIIQWVCLTAGIILYLIKTRGKVTSA